MAHALEGETWREVIPLHFLSFSIEVSFRLCSLLFGLVFISFFFLQVSCLDALIPSYTRRSRQEHEKRKIPTTKNRSCLGSTGWTDPSCVWFNSRARVRNCQTRVWRRCC
ncbi:hypothetical protein LZ31DRAFT_337895 [Colletotrichum somersetense]|nr:hypothetical protein LZ31DRAFT_337895 [Colletotrichum somersetense]